MGDWIRRDCVEPNQEQGKIIAYGEGYVFECEWDDGCWCNIGGADFTHWMPHPGYPE
jgi:hypothetical protein